MGLWGFGVMRFWGYEVIEIQKFYGYKVVLDAKFGTVKPYNRKTS